MTRIEILPKTDIKGICKRGVICGSHVFGLKNTNIYKCLASCEEVLQIISVIVAGREAWFRIAYHQDTVLKSRHIHKANLRLPW